MEDKTKRTIADWLDIKATANGLTNEKRKEFIKLCVTKSLSLHIDKLTRNEFLILWQDFENDLRIEQERKAFI
jgi:hypothetical protein